VPGSKPADGTAGDPADENSAAENNAAGSRSGRPLSRPARWLAGRTLRGRLIAGLLVLLALACATVGTVTYAHLHSVLIGQLDEQLVAASQRYGSCMDPSMPPGQGNDGHSGDGNPQHGNPSLCSQQQATNTFSASVASGGIRNPYLAGNPDDCHLSATDAAEVAKLPAGDKPRTVTLSSLGTYQLLATASPDGDGVYVSGLPLSSVNNTLRQVALAEIAVFSAALVLAGIIGTGWVRLSLRPLRRVAATATRVTELPLGTGQVALPDRVPDANPNTEVGQVGAAFNRMLGHVESALARRAASEARLRRFAADASHELRTPLAAIRGYAELARRQPGPVPEAVAHALSRVESESARMSVLVDELLLLAQLDAGRPLASEPVDLTRLAIDVTSDARVAAPGHRWMLELPDVPVLVRGDDHRLHQVLVNLLSNAAKHTPKGTTVTVKLAVSGGAGGSSADAGSAAAGPQPGPGTVAVTVTDDGPGIPAELQPTLFERFVRGDSSRSRTAGSTGLGLAIVDAVTAAHHGRVELSSQPGQTRFTITLPRLAEPDSQAAAAPVRS
jgi:two-component system OmpR family sensor kinase